MAPPPPPLKEERTIPRPQHDAPGGGGGTSSLGLLKPGDRVRERSHEGVLISREAGTARVRWDGSGAERLVYLRDLEGTVPYVPDSPPLRRLSVLGCNAIASAFCVAGCMLLAFLLPRLDVGDWWAVSLIGPAAFGAGYWRGFATSIRDGWHPVAQCRELRAEALRQEAPPGPGGPP